jgi:hypothetical protein
MQSLGSFLVEPRMWLESLPDSLAGVEWNAGIFQAMGDEPRDVVNTLDRVHLAARHVPDGAPPRGVARLGDTLDRNPDDKAMGASLVRLQRFYIHMSPQRNAFPSGLAAVFPCSI